MKRNTARRFGVSTSSRGTTMRIGRLLPTMSDNTGTSVSEGGTGRGSRAQQAIPPKPRVFNSGHSLADNRSSH